MLLLVELRVREDIGGEVDDGIEVARQREARQRYRIAGHADLDGGAEGVERLVELRAITATGTTAREQGGVTVQAFDPERVSARPAADRDVKPDQRGIGRGLDDDNRTAHAASSSSASLSAPASGSAITIVRRSGRRYAFTTRATSSAVTCARRSARWVTLRKSPSAIS